MHSNLKKGLFLVTFLGMTVSREFRLWQQMGTPQKLQKCRA